MLVKSVIYFISLSITVEVINSDENVYSIDEKFNNHQIDNESLKYNNNTTFPTITQKLLLLPYKPFKKPIKGNTNTKNSSFTIKPSFTTIGNKKKKGNVTTTTTLKPNTPFIEENPTTISDSSEVELNFSNIIELTTQQVPEEINLQTIAMEITTVVSDDDTEISTETDKATSVDLLTDTTQTFVYEKEGPTTLAIEVDNTTPEDHTNTLMDETPEINDGEISDICKHGYEYHAIEGECDTFIECKKRVAYKKKCPEGLLFNSLMSWPKYPCSYPSEVKCNGRITQSSNPTGECKHQYGFFPSSKQNCSQYVMCQEGTAFTLSCPQGLVFNTETNSCDWPANVPNCPSTALDNYDCPESSSETVTELKYRYGNSCRDYVLCLDGHPRLLKCGLGLAFDEKKGFCVDSDHVQNCA